jgi:mRNA-degrading endonuclease toxin of MazEF toxin-antitoxin module
MACLLSIRYSYRTLAFLSPNLLKSSSIKSIFLISPLLIQSPFSRKSSSYIFERGDVFLIKFSRRLEQGNVVSSKDGNRPALIVSANPIIEKTDHLVLANISGNIARVYPFEVYIAADKMNGLDKDSKVMTNQLFTLKKSIVKNPIISQKIGSLNAYELEKVNKGLTLCLSPLLSENEPLFPRGSVVETITPSGSRIHGVIISNDLGNLRSKIVLLSPSKNSKLVDDTFQVVVEILVKISNERIKMRVDCNEVDAADQKHLKVIGKIFDTDMKKIETKIFFALGLTT